MSEKLKHPTLLVIADNPSIRHWIKKNLEDQFYIIEASNRPDAAKAVQTIGLNFIILDSYLEEGDPLALARELRAINTTVPILLITGRLKKTFREEALAAGVTDFLNDQLAADELELCIEAGQKAAETQIKTSRLSSEIKPAGRTPSDEYFKNRVLLNERALRLLSDIKKENETISLLLFRVDRLAELQEKEGWTETNGLLIRLLERIHQDLRSKDLLIPSSNSRFILLLPRTPVDEAEKIAERLRRDIQREPFELNRKKIHLTVSIAVSPLNAEKEQYQRIVAEAGQALSGAEAMHNFIISLKKEPL